MFCPRCGKHRLYYDSYNNLCCRDCQYVIESDRKIMICKTCKFKSFSICENESSNEYGKSEYNNNYKLDEYHSCGLWQPNVLYIE